MSLWQISETFPLCCYGKHLVGIWTATHSNHIQMKLFYFCLYINFFLWWYFWPGILRLSNEWQDRTFHAPGIARSQFFQFQRDRAIMTSAGFSLPFLIEYATYQARHLYMPLHISSPSCFFIALRILSPRQHTHKKYINSFLYITFSQNPHVCLLYWFFWSFVVVVVVVVVVVSIKVRLLHFIWV